jgi:predicted DNA-binding protein YlxM (UPF0122 family)
MELSKVIPAVVAAVAGVTGGGVAGVGFSRADATAQREEIRMEFAAADLKAAVDAELGRVDLQLEQIEAKLKLYRTIEETRALTADEAADREYQIENRALLRERRLKLLDDRRAAG